MYRIVKHTPKKETQIKEWTFHPAINRGDEKNVLEVHDQGDKMSFYINANFATTVFER